MPAGDKGGRESHVEPMVFKPRADDPSNVCGVGCYYRNSGPVESAVRCNKFRRNPKGSTLPRRRPYRISTRNTCLKAHDAGGSHCGSPTTAATAVDGSATR